MQLFEFVFSLLLMKKILGFARVITSITKKGLRHCECYKINWSV